MSSYGNEMLARGRIDEWLREADRERPAREARAGTRAQRRGRVGRIVTIARWASGLSARILRAPDARERDRHGAAL